jgi:DNA-binding transcriptional regulator/RsmH inhibitor MraZ
MLLALIADLAVLVGAGEAHVVWDAQQWVSTHQQHLQNTTAARHTHTRSASTSADNPLTQEANKA